MDMVYYSWSKSLLLEKKKKGYEMTPVLYILMRTDMTSLNAGKAMAQASHATNAFIPMPGAKPIGQVLP